MSPAELATLSDTELLELRFCDLPIRLEGSLVAARADRVFAELQSRGLLARPSIWLAEEWYNPDGVTGFAIPFYLAHPRLIRLERKLMLEAEGVSEQECLRILRHETGHAIDEAYQLYRTRAYRDVFGRPNRAYPKRYSPRPESRAYVTHLNAWYAQSHPVEDFAETFAVWLLPRTVWHRRYRGWPALEKLKAVDSWMAHLAGRQPVVAPDDQHADELQTNTKSLARHYQEKRAFYRVGMDALQLDKGLLKIFSAAPRRTGDTTALAFLRLHRSSIRKRVARPLGVPAYTADQVLRLILLRCKQLKLRHDKPTGVAIEGTTKLVARATMTLLENSPRLPL